MKILITGASGFIGSFLVEEGLRRGDEVWAGVRRSSSRRYLQDGRIHFVELDFGEPETLVRQLAAHREKHGAWEVVVHCAGVTKCPRREEFLQGNYLATRRFVEALTAADMVPRQFIYLSSLSVFGPIHETDYSPIREEDQPRPATLYGESKLQTEQFLQSLPGFPWLLLRPTGVYGPRERDYYLMARSIRQHIDFAAGLSRQDLTFVYVKDLVQAVYLAVERQVIRRAYFVSDGQVYASRAFSDLIRRELGHPRVLRFCCPLPLLKVLAGVAGGVASLTGHSCTLNRDKYHILKQRNWQCDIAPLVRELGYRPAYPLERGVRETIAWYKEAGWL